MVAATLVDMANHPALPLPVKDSDLETLRALVRARTTEQRLVQRARIVPACGGGRAEPDDRRRGRGGADDGPVVARPLYPGRPGWPGRRAPARASADLFAGG